MFNRIGAGIAALLLAITLAAPTPVAAANNGFCVANQWPANQTGQWYFDKNVAPGGQFDEVIGWLTDRPLWPCEGLGIGQGWSFAAAANIQGETGLFQLGFIQVAGQAGDQNYFVYTPFDGSGQAVPISSPRPTFGNRYKFQITKFPNTGQVYYRIYTSGGTLLWSPLGGTFPTSNSAKAWWGYETGNSRSLAGIDPNSAAADLVGQYSWVGSSTIWTRTNYGTACSSPSGGPICSVRAFMTTSGSSNEIFNVRGQTTG